MDILEIFVEFKEYVERLDAMKYTPTDTPWAGEVPLIILNNFELEYAINHMKHMGMPETASVLESLFFRLISMDQVLKHHVNFACEEIKKLKEEINKLKEGK